MNRPLFLALFALLGASQARAQAPQTPIRLPRGESITVDGRVEDSEWRNAMRVEHPAGTVVRLMRDADYLYAGITSDRQGFASLCLATANDEVHVLHASAALGAITYRRTGSAWNAADTAFTYSMRSPALDSVARAERAAYLAAHGWVASTIRMGADQRSQEIQIAFRKFPSPFSLAIGRWLTAANRSEWWPATITDHDGCFSQQLVTGFVPQGIVFKPAFWLKVGG
jgi:hypothetical protein